MRLRLGVTTREVEEQSRKIAATQRNNEFFISNAWLSQLENLSCLPSIYKLYSLCIIYRVSYLDLLRLYGVDLEKSGKHQLRTRLYNTHPARIEVYDKEKAISFPIRFDRGFRLDRTNLIARMVEVWGEVPIGLLQHLNIRQGKYGYIGLKDYTMYPLLRPGSFVQIDDRQDTVKPFGWRTEHDRPIYFVELREGYACSWCELRNGTLTLVPHPLSPARIRQFAHPTEAEVVGRVTAVAMRIVNSEAGSRLQPARLPRRS